VAAQSKGLVTLYVADVPGGVKVHHEHTLAIGAECAVALRPEKLHIWQVDPGEDAVNRMHGVVAEIGYLGASCIFRVRTDGGRTIQVMQPNQARDLSLAYQWDEPVWVSWAPESGVLIVG
jgi:putrescine transport system ATP-binding protein